MTFQLSTSARKKLPKALEKRRISQIFFCTQLFGVAWSQVARVLSNTNFASTFAADLRAAFFRSMLFQKSAKNQHQDGIWQSQVGTPYYLSPEICEEKPYNELSDVGVPRVCQGIPSRRDATACHRHPGAPTKIGYGGSTIPTYNDAKFICSFFTITPIIVKYPRNRDLLDRFMRCYTILGEVWAFGCVVYEMCTLRRIFWWWLAVIFKRLQGEYTSADLRHEENLLKVEDPWRMILAHVWFPLSSAIASLHCFLVKFAVIWWAVFCKRSFGSNSFCYLRS